MEQVAVSCVDFNEVKTGGEGALSGGGKCADDGVDVCLIQGLRDSVVGRERNWTGSDRLPPAFFGREQAITDEGRGHGGFASCVGELNACADALSVDERCDALEAGDVLVLVNAEIAGGDAALGHDRGGLKHDEAGSALGTAPEVDHVPVVGEAVFCGVLAHGRDADAVGEGDGPKLKRRKKRMAHGCAEARKMNMGRKQWMIERRKGCKGSGTGWIVWWL